MLQFEDMHDLILSTVYSLVKIFQDKCMLTETTDVTGTNIKLK